MQKFANTIMIILCAALIGAGVVYFLQQNSQQETKQVSDDDSGFPRTEEQLRLKVAEFRMEQKRINRGIKRLEEQKQDSIDYLKSKGINSSADLPEDDADVKFAMRQLKMLSENIAARKKDAASYDDAIAALDAMQADLKRKFVNDSVTLSPDDYKDVDKIVIGLNDQLGTDTEPDLLEAQALRELLDAELKKSAQDGSN